MYEKLLAAGGLYFFCLIPSLIISGYFYEGTISLIDPELHQIVLPIFLVSGLFLLINNCNEL